MTAKRTTYIEAAVVLALFSFVFLESEFFFDTRMGIFVAAQDVTSAQNLVLGASALGFASFAGLRRVVPGRAKEGLIPAATALGCLCLVAIASAGSPLALFASGCFAFFLMGIIGGATHWKVALALANDAFLSRVVGAGYAGGIALQFLSNQLVPSAAPKVIALCIGSMALAALVLKAKPKTANRRPEEGGANAVCAESARSAKPALCAIGTVVFLSCLFSTLDNVVTIANAEEVVDVEQWPRLFLAASGLAAGFLFDFRAGAYRNISMFCIALLSTCSLLATEAGMGPLGGLLVFYLGSGFFVVFFTSTFLSLAPWMRSPELWAGAGRAINNLCACLLSGLSLALVQTGNTALIMVAALVLFVAIAVCFALANRFEVSKRQEIARSGRRISPSIASTVDGDSAFDDQPGIGAESALSEEERLSSFAQRFELTPREQDVLLATMSDERPLKQVASDLGISLRMVQKHLASIYQKTGSQTRAGLAKKYWE